MYEAIVISRMLNLCKSIDRKMYHCDNQYSSLNNKYWIDVQGVSSHHHLNITIAYSRDQLN